MPDNLRTYIPRGLNLEGSRNLLEGTPVPVLEQVADELWGRIKIELIAWIADTRRESDELLRRAEAAGALTRPVVKTDSGLSESHKLNHSAASFPDVERVSAYKTRIAQLQRRYGAAELVK